MSDPERYVIWGSSGHAKVLGALIAQRGGRVEALFDNDPNAVSALPGVPVYIGQAGFARWCEEAARLDEVYGLAAIGGSRGRDRMAIQEAFAARGIRLAPLVHPKAFVCETASVGAGSQVLALAVVAADARVGAACILNHRSAADHECVLGDGVHLAPGATLCGCVVVGDNVLIGPSAVVLPRVKIGSNTIVGAGSVVTRDLPEGVVAYGNPARVVRAV